MPNSMSEKIHRLRKQHNLTLEEVANIVGVGKSTVRKWETGMIANMRRDKIALLAKALHTTPAYLMGWEEPEINSTLFVSDSSDQIPTPDEQELLKLFRQIPAEQQRVFLEMGRVYANSLKKD